MTSPPRILVTGAAGGLGRRLRAELHAQGRIASFIVSPRLGKESADSAVDVADITDTKSLSVVVARRKPDVIVHLAAVTGARCETDPKTAWAVNVDAVRSLAQIARDNGVSRFVLASTSAVYGDQYTEPVSESGPLVLTSEYARTKRYAELALEEVAEGSVGLTAVSLRIFNVYGPGMSTSLANRLVEATPESAITLAGLDSFVRDYVHVDDVAQALVLAAEVPVASAWSIINIGSGQPTSNRELIAALAPVHAVEGEPRTSYSCAQVSVARNLLGFTVQRPLMREGLTGNS